MITSAGLLALISAADGGVDQLVLVAVEVAIDQQVAHAIPGHVVQQQAAEHAGLGLYRMRRHAQLGHLAVGWRSSGKVAIDGQGRTADMGQLLSIRTNVSNASRRAACGRHNPVDKHRRCRGGKRGRAQSRPWAAGGWNPLRGDQAVSP